MAFFNDLGNKLGSAAEATAAKAKELSEVAKLNSQISSEEKQIEKLYSEIGKLIYAENKDNPQGSSAELCTQINTAQTTIASLKEKIQEIKSH